jgi:TRAP-type C4-dicarboxylate transport system substrate-binding protein
LSAFRATLLLPRITRALVVLFALCTAAAAGELRISHQFHETADSRGRAARIFAEEASLRSPELTLRIYPQLSLGLSRDEQLEALQSGKLDFAVLPLVFGMKKIPEFSLALLPGLIPNLATARALKGSDVHTKLQEVAAANGLRIITWWWMRGGFATTSKEITTPESVKGLKLQTCGLASTLLTGAGAHLGDEPWEEISLRMEMGAIDGVAVPYEERLTREAVAIIEYSWVTNTRWLRLKWSDFRGLSILEQVCWAFLAVVSVVCVTIRVL